MISYVVDDASGTGLAVISCEGFVPPVHYGNPPLRNGEFVLDGSKLRRREAYRDLDTGMIMFASVAPEYYRDWPVSSGPGMWKTPVPSPVKFYWEDTTVTPHVWKDNAVDPAPEGVQLHDTRVTPSIFWHVDVDPAKDSSIDTDKLNFAKGLKIQALKQKFDSIITAPFTWTDGHTYQADAEARRNLGNALSIVMDNSPATRTWYDIANVQRTFTASDFKAMCKAMWDRGDAAFDVLQTKKNEIIALTTLVAVKAYDETAGW